MVRILREADAEPVTDVARRHGVSEQTIYTWRKKYGGCCKNGSSDLCYLNALLSGTILIILPGKMCFPIAAYQIVPLYNAVLPSKDKVSSSGATYPGGHAYSETP